jgi:uncharacterized membrane protein YqjE
MKKFAVIGSIMLLVLFTLVSLPLLIIWSLNNLFKLDIAYNLKDWFSILVLLTILNAHFKTSRSLVKKDK